MHLKLSDSEESCQTPQLIGPNSTKKDKDHRAKLRSAVAFLLAQKSFLVAVKPIGIIHACASSTIAGFP